MTRLQQQFVNDYWSISQCGGQCKLYSLNRNSNIIKKNPCVVVVNMLDYDFIVSSNSSHAIMFTFGLNTLRERYEHS